MGSWGGIIVAGRSSPGAWDIAGVDSACLAPVANRPLLAHGLDVLREAGVSRIDVVCESGIARAVNAAVAAASDSLPVRVVQVPDGSGEVAAVLAAIEARPVTRLLILAGDAYVDEDVVSALERIDADALDALVLARAKTRVGARDPRGAAPQVEVLPRLGQHAGVVLLGSRGIARLRDLEPEAVGHTGLEQISATVYGQLRDVGGEEGSRLRPGADSLLDLNRRALDRIDRAMPDGDAIHDCTIHGAVRIHESASLRRSLIRGPVVIGARARIEDAYVGPYTAVGDGCTIRATEVEHSVLLEGAHVSDVGWRIDSSVIGSGARVSRTFVLPKALHMQIGPGARVTVS